MSSKAWNVKMQNSIQGISKSKRENVEKQESHNRCCWLTCCCDIVYTGHVLLVSQKGLANAGSGFLDLESAY